VPNYGLALQNKLHTALLSYYRKAVTTEILQNLAVEGDTRSYLMHGVWESVWDHENSAIAARAVRHFEKSPSI